MIAVVPFLIVYAPDVYAAPITIPEPSGYPTTTNLDYFGYNEIYNNRSAILDSELFSPENNNDKGEIYIQSNTRVLPHPQFTPGERLISVFDVLTNNPANITKPSNVVGNHNILLIHSTVTTPPGPHTYSRILSGNTGTAPLLLNKEVRVSINSTAISSPKPFFFSTFENITQGHPIPECSATNFDSSAQTLKGNYKMCFGVLDDYVVVITKRLGHFGVTAALNAPSTPIDIHARTLSIPPPNDFPTLVSSTEVPLLSSSSNVDTATFGGNIDVRYQIDGLVFNVPVKAGDIYIPGITTILSHPLFSGKSYDCTYGINSIYAAGTRGYSIAYPTNIQPAGNATNPASMIFSGHSDCANLSHAQPMITDKEMRITLTNKTGSEAYYFSPSQNITAAQPIPACTDDTIHLNNGTLKGDTKMCYGVYQSDLIIVTKRLGAYGAADTITPPQNPIDLDSDRPPPTMLTTSSSEPVSVELYIHSDGSARFNLGNNTNHTLQAYHQSQGSILLYNDTSISHPIFCSIRRLYSWN